MSENEVAQTQSPAEQMRYLFAPDLDHEPQMATKLHSPETIPSRRSL